MISGINPSAGTAGVQGSMVQHATSPATGSAPKEPITAPRSAAQANVSKLFQVTHELSSQLQGLLDGAEARRLQGMEGMDMNAAAGPIAEIQQELSELKQRAPSMGRFTEEIAAQVQQVVQQGGGSIARLAETVNETQQRMAEKYGYVGNIVNMKV
jgi:response regulator RpfG family c-di-GMP phosphodiesterase